MRKRKIIKYAGMWVIKLLPADALDFDLSEGDEVDIEDLGLLQVNHKLKGKKRIR